MGKSVVHDLGLESAKLLRRWQLAIDEKVCALDGSSNVMWGQHTEQNDAERQREVSSPRGSCSSLRIGGLALSMYVVDSGLVTRSDHGLPASCSIGYPLRREQKSWTV